jgi:uncharacterized protein (DUF362 family)
MSPNSAIPVGLARTEPTYAGLEPPFGPGKTLPKLVGLLGDSGANEPSNHVYAAVRAALWSLGLDAENFGSADWNPLGTLTPRGSHIVLKPNFIRHWNSNANADSVSASVESVITHGAVLRAMVDYAFLAAGVEGSVTIAEAPQHDCDFEKIREIAGLDEMVRLYEDELGRELEIIDLRRESVTYRDAVIIERRPLPGDPRGYRMIDLGSHSAFEGSGLDPQRFRGADYDPGPTTEHHRDGRNEYLLSETVLSADLVVNLPKLKTHKKTGVTLALKNLVGINGDKNLLPHHCVGSVDQGGDEYPGSSWFDATRSLGTEAGRALLKRQMGARFIRWARRVEEAIRGDDFIRSGNWYGNRTTWRMCVDLNRCFYYSDAKGEDFEASEPIRKVLTVMDGVVAGEGDGPLRPGNIPLGSVIAATDPIALDLVALRLMGFDEQNIPKIWEPMNDRGLRITSVNNPRDVVVCEVDAGSCDVRHRSLNEISGERTFLAHPGWIGHIEGKLT